MIGSLSEVQTDTVPVPLEVVQNSVCEESTVGSGGGGGDNVCGGCEIISSSHIECERPIQGDDKSSMKGWKRLTLGQQSKTSKMTCARFPSSCLIYTSSRSPFAQVSGFLCSYGVILSVR